MNIKTPQFTEDIISPKCTKNTTEIKLLVETKGSKDSPVDAAELQLESQQAHTESGPYSSTHLRKNSEEGMILLS